MKGMTVAQLINEREGGKMNNKKLNNLYNEFVKRMFETLDEHEQDGWEGWDNKREYPNHDFNMRIITKLLDPDATKEDMVDIANYAMFLYKRKPEEV